MGLDLTGDALERGVGPHGDRGGPPGALLVHEPPGVDTVRGDEARGLRGQVGGGKAELPATGRTVDHLATHAVGPTEQLGGTRDVTRLQARANPGGRAAPVLPAWRGTVRVIGVRCHGGSGNVLHDHHVEAVLVSQLADGGEVPRVVPAQPDVGADDQGDHAQRVHEVVHEELLGAELGELQAVRQDEHGVHTGLLERVELVLEAHDEAGVGLRTVHQRGVRVKRDHHRVRLTPPGGVQEPGEDLLVAPVDTVEVADAHHGGTESRRDLVQASPANHSSPRCLLGWWRIS